MRSKLPAPIIACLCLYLSHFFVLSPHCASAGAQLTAADTQLEEAKAVESLEAAEGAALAKSSILKSDRIDEGPFQRSQSKRAATLAKSLPLISTTKQIAKANDEQTAAATAAATTATASQTTMENAMHTNANLSVPSAAASALPIPIPIHIQIHSDINNISNNGDQQHHRTSGLTMATSVPGVTAALQANLIMSNRNVDEQELDEHKYKITQSNALFPHGSSSSSSSNIKNFTATAETAETAAATIATETATAESTTTPSTTTTTTRRPAPRTTLKPPPTIDDYQTIISQAGTHAYLPCNVKQLVKKPISWLRMRDGHILTVDQTTFIADQRFQSVFSPNPERWSLQIKYVQLKDEGTYECQVSTEPKASAIVHLRIVEPKTELIGESTRHVKAGSQVKLRCIISQALEPPLFINWFYNQKQIYLHNRRGWRTEIERIDLPAEASTTAATSTTTSTAAEGLNDIAAITRSYILDAIAVSDGSASSGYGYMLATADTPTTAKMSTTTAAAVEVGGAAADTPPILTTTMAAAATMTTPTEEATTTTTTTTISTTTTTTEASTTTTTLLPSSSFIKQITTASLIIPAVVKQDSGNYTCSPSNSAPRTIVLHVLNGEYSASAIKSASVSWNTLIGCPGYLHWRNISTILTLLWIIKFVFAKNMAICCSNAKNNANNGPAALQESTTPATTAKPTSRTTAAGESVSRRIRTQTQTATRRQWHLGYDCGVGGGNCGNVSSSISGTKVAEDKT